jgi:hypothetical protein
MFKNNNSLNVSNGLQLVHKQCKSKLKKQLLCHLNLSLYKTMNKPKNVFTQFQQHINYFASICVDKLIEVKGL